MNVHAGISRIDRLDHRLRRLIWSTLAALLDKRRAGDFHNFICMIQRAASSQICDAVHHGQLLRGHPAIPDDPSEIASRTTLARFIQAGVVPTSANAVICELQRTWNREDAAPVADLYTMVSPNYRAVIESFQKAQDVAIGQRRAS